MSWILLDVDNKDCETMGIPYCNKTLLNTDHVEIITRGYTLENGVADNIKIITKSGLKIESNKIHSAWDDIHSALEEHARLIAKSYDECYVGGGDQDEIKAILNLSTTWD